MGFCCAVPAFTRLDLDATDAGLVQLLRRRPGLLCDAAPASFLGMHDSALHLASERKSVKSVQQIFDFLLVADLEVLQRALKPYCRRLKIPPPATPADALRMATNITNTKGQTPLMYACYANAPDIVKELLNQGADPWVADRCGCRNAMHYAAMSGSASCVEALLQHMPPSLLTRQGIRYVNARSLSGLTPLHYAVFFEHAGAVEALLRHEPAINAGTTAESYDVWLTVDTYSTPLHFAALKNHLPSARLLLLHYARRRHTGSVLDPRLRRNSAGLMPWQLARGGPLGPVLQPGRPITEALALAGADVDLADGDEQVGAPLLAAIAAAALRQKLLGEVEVIEREVIEEEEVRQQQAARGSSLLCGTPRRAAWRTLSRSVSRLSSRAASGRAPAAAMLPASPGRAPTLDRLDGTSPHAGSQPGAYGGAPQSQPPAWAWPLPGRIFGGRNRQSSEGGAAVSASGLPRSRSGRLRSGKPQASSSRLSTTGAGNAAGSQRCASGVPAGASPTAVLYPAYSLGRGSPTAARTPFPAFGAAHATGVGAANLPAVAGDIAGGSPTSARASGGRTSLVYAPASFPALGTAPALGSGFARAPTGGSPVGGSPHDSGVHLAGDSPTNTSAANAVQRPSPPPSLRGGSPRGASPVRASHMAAAAALGAPAMVSPFAAAAGVGDVPAGSSGEQLHALPQPPGWGPAASLRAGSLVLTSADGVEDECEGTCNVCFARRETVAPALCHHGLCAACAGELCRAMTNRPLLCPFCRQPVTAFVRVVAAAVG